MIKLGREVGAFIEFAQVFSVEIFRVMVEFVDFGHFRVYLYATEVMVACEFVAHT